MKQIRSNVHIWTNLFHEIRIQWMWIFLGFVTTLIISQISYRAIVVLWLQKLKSRKGIL